MMRAIDACFYYAQNVIIQRNTPFTNPLKTSFLKEDLSTLVIRILFLKTPLKAIN